MESKQIEIKFGNQPKIFGYISDNLELSVGDFVVAESSRGIELGKVTSNSKDIKNEEGQEIKKIIRIATPNDIKTAKDNKIKANSYIDSIKNHIKKLNLQMKVVGAELTLDNSKIIISFTAENRVDFRELVKNLAGTFRMKIELRQIGARDEVQIMGGVGVCGKPCCCHRFGSDFEHVSIKMAKVQGLSLNPNNISGLCGKLLCCLAYENEAYVETFKKMPRVNSEVKTPDGNGRVLYNNILKKTVQVLVDDNVNEYPLEDIVVFNANNIENNDK